MSTVAAKSRTGLVGTACAETLIILDRIGLAGGSHAPRSSTGVGITYAETLTILDRIGLAGGSHALRSGPGVAV